MTNHITPIVLAIIKNNDKYLLTKRVDFQNPKFHEVWQIVGGGLEFGETAEAGMRREVLEETGLTIQSCKLLPGPYEKIEEDWHGIFFIFVCKLENPDQELVLDQEATEWGWFTFKELKKLKLFPNSLQLLRDAQNS